MTILKNKIVYFLGIGGIGMSALARYCLLKGCKVSGYDRTRTALTTSLEDEGMLIHYQENTAAIPADVDFVVFTPAIPSENSEFQYFIEKKVPMLKRAEMLGKLSEEYKTIACAGTHGKTTTSTLIAHLLNGSTIGCQAFLGGISRNFNSNLLLSETSPYLVAEADEFDRSFLHLKPHIAIVTSMDADHLDIYGSEKHLLAAFSDFAANIRKDGFLVIKKGLELSLKNKASSHCFTYSVGSDADFRAVNIRLEDGLYHFDLVFPQGKIAGLKLGIPGFYNVENAVAACAASLLCKVAPVEIRRGLADFAGVQRRFDIRFKTNDLVYIDDYAHHPEELRACIQSARAMYSGRKITGVFQPHLFSRTRDFAEGFAEALSLLDEIILLPIYPARELPMQGIDSEMLLKIIKSKEKALIAKEELVNYLKNRQLEVLLTLGAGDIDTLVQPLEEMFNNRKLL